MEFVGLYEDMDICGNPGDWTTTATTTTTATATATATTWDFVYPETKANG